MPPDKLARLADSMRGQTENRARKAKMLDHRVERMEAVKVNAPKHDRRYNVKFPPPASIGSS